MVLAALAGDLFACSLLFRSFGALAITLHALSKVFIAGSDRGEWNLWTCNGIKAETDTVPPKPETVSVYENF